MRFVFVAAVFALASTVSFAATDSSMPSAAATARAPAPLSLERLKEGVDYAAGCGCTVANARGETLLFREVDRDDIAVIRLDGRPRKLKLASSTERHGVAPKLGDTFTQLWSKGGTKLRLDYRTTFVCAPNDESCEVTRYRVDASIEDGTRSGRLKNLDADCGC